MKGCDNEIWFLVGVRYLDSSSSSNCSSAPRRGSAAGGPPFSTGSRPWLQTIALRARKTPNTAISSIRNSMLARRNGFSGPAVEPYPVAAAPASPPPKLWPPRRCKADLSAQALAKT